jgi:hypothetical protein
MTAVCLTKQQRLRAELAYLRARYDHGAVSPAVYETIKQIETKLAWSEHHYSRIAAEQEAS